MLSQLLTNRGSIQGGDWVPKQAVLGARSMTQGSLGAGQSKPSILGEASIEADAFAAKHPGLARDYAFLRQPTQRHQWMQGVRDAVRRDPAFLDGLGLTDGEKQAVRGLLVKAGVIQDPSRGMMGRLMDRVGEGFWDRIGGVDWGRHRAGGQLQELVGVEEPVPGVDDAAGRRIAGDVLKRLATRGELVASESVMHQRRLLGDGGASVSNGRRAMPVAGDSRVGLREESFVGEPTSNMVFFSGEEFQVNTYTTDDQINPSVTALNDGFVVTWESDGQDGSGYGVYGQLYDGNGGRVGTEFRVNTYTSSYQSKPSVTALNDGFVVTWESYQDGSRYGVYGQLYDGNGGRVGSEFRVNTHTSDSQDYSSIAALNDGFVVTWQSDGQDGSREGVYGQLYDANGGRVGTEFRVNTYTDEWQRYPSVTALNDGFVVVWESYLQDGSSTGVYGQLYDGNGGRVGTEFRVNTYTGGIQENPSVTALNDGFVVTWQSLLGQDGYGVYGQLYDGNGGRVGTEFRVNTYTDDWQMSPSVIALNDGFVVTWRSGYHTGSGQDGSLYGVYGQLYDGNGGRVGTEFQVNTYTDNRQENPSVTALNDGFVVAWQSEGQDGSESGIYAKKYRRSPLDISQISDSAAIGDRVGNFSDRYTYTLVAGEGDTHNAYVSISGTGLYLQQLLNYNTVPTITIRIRATDSAGDYVDTALVISVSNSNAVSNAPPTAVGVSSTQVMESLSVGSVVATLDATDPNNADEHTYELIAGDGDGDNTYFNINGNELLLAKPLDYETQSSLTIRVRATDAGGLFVDQTITLSVQDVNEPSTNTNMVFFSGEEFQVNTYTTNDQAASVITSLSNGFVVTWDSSGQDGSGYGIYGQLFDLNGNKVGSEFQINTYTTSSQYNRSVTALNDGFIVTWQSYGQDGSSWGIYSQLFDLNGNKLGAEFRVNTYVNSAQENPSVACLNDGFVVTWQSYGQDGSSDGIYAQFFDFNGTRVGSEFQVNTYTTNYQHNPSVTALNDGFVVTWMSSGQDGDGYGIYGQLFNSNGIKVGVEFRVNTYTSSDQQWSSVTALHDGFVVTWESNGQDGSGKGVYGQLFDSNGTPVKSEFQINTYVTNDQSLPSVAALNDGFVVTWDSNGQDGSGEGLYGQFFDSNGNKVGVEFQINTYTTSRQRDSSVTALNDGFVVIWRSSGQDGSGYGIYGKKYRRSPLDISQISDSAAIGDRVGNFNDGYTYTLVAGEGDTHNAYVSISGTGLYLQQLLNYNTVPTITIRIRATDSAGDYTDYAIVISVSNSNAVSNAPPTAVGVSSTQVMESVSVGSVVATLDATDPNNADEHTYELIAGDGDSDNTYFNINGNELLLAKPLDYETQSSLTIRVRATDAGGLFVDQIITLSVQNVNEPPTDIQVNNMQIAESATIGTTIGTLTVLDSDFNDTHTYTLIDAANYPDNIYVRIENGQLVLNRVVDYENKQSLQIRIQATDAEGATIVKTITIAINNVNEPPTDIQVNNMQIAESATIGTTIGTLTVLDSDFNDTHTYTLIDAANYPDNIYVRIENGQLVLNRVVDYENKQSLQIRIQATDAEGATIVKTITITINNVNEPPTDIQVNNMQIAESATIGTAIGTLTVLDSDFNDTHTYTLIDAANYPDNIYVRIENGQLVLNRVVDYENKQSLQIRVQATDAEGATIVKTITIAINNVNEPPTDIQVNNMQIAESATIGTTIGTLTVLDSDFNDTHTYTLIDAANYPDNIYVRIENGQLVLNRVVDYENKQSLQIRIQATDAEGATIVKTITIAINNVNEPPTDIQGNNMQISESATVGTAIGTLTVLDADFNDTHTYALIDAANYPDNIYVRIQNGQLVLNQVVNYADKQSLQIRIQATDSQGNTIVKTLTISVGRTNQTPAPVQISTTQIPESITVGDTVTKLDEGDNTHTYELIDINSYPDNAYVRIEGNRLILAQSIQLSVQLSLNIRIQSINLQGAVVIKTLVIAIGGGRQSATVTQQVPSAIGIGVGSNTVVGTFAQSDSQNTYRLVSGEGDAYNYVFTIVGNQLITTQTIPSEWVGTISIRIEIQNSSGVRTEKIIPLHMVSPINDVTLSKSTILENQPIDTIVGQLGTNIRNDTDTRYQLVSGEGDTDNGYFQIVSSELRTAQVMDFESKNTFSIRVEGDRGGSRHEKSMRIQLMNQNEAPNDIVFNERGLTIDAVASGTSVGTLVVSDPDRNDTHTCDWVQTAEYPANAYFSIVNRDVRARAVVLNRYNQMRVRCIDPGNLSVNKTISLSLGAAAAQTSPQISPQTSPQASEIPPISETAVNQATPAPITEPARFGVQARIPNQRYYFRGGYPSFRFNIKDYFSGVDTDNLMITFTLNGEVIDGKEHPWFRFSSTLGNDWVEVSIQLDDATSGTHDIGVIATDGASSVNQTFSIALLESSESNNNEPDYDIYFRSQVGTGLLAGGVSALILALIGCVRCGRQRD